MGDGMGRKNTFEINVKKKKNELLKIKLQGIGRGDFSRKKTQFIVIVVVHC